MQKGIFTTITLMLFLASTSAFAWSPKSVDLDPMVGMPGTQPNPDTYEIPPAGGQGEASVTAPFPLSSRSHDGERLCIE